MSNSSRFLPSRRAILAGLTALPAAALLLSPRPGSAATPAESYVTRVGNSVIAAANAGSSSQFRSVLRQHADIPSIALFSLGQYRKNLSSSQRQEYFRLVEQYISSLFSTHAGKLKGQKLVVTGSREVKDSVVVNSRLSSSKGDTPVTWRLVKKGGGYRIFDVNVEGIWLASTQKTNFTSVLQKNNGSVDALLAYLRQ